MEKPKGIKAKEIKLTPTIFRKIIEGFKSIVENADHIILFGQKIESELPLKIGAEVVLQFENRGIAFYYTEELLKYREYLTERERLKRLTHTFAIKKKSDDFWLDKNLPFAHSIEIKEVLSGLSPNSSGNGMKRNTVYHVFLQESFQKGRLKRSAGDFLCQNSKSKYNGNWSGSLGSGGNEQVKPIVTCKKCLEIINKINDNKTGS